MTHREKVKLARRMMSQREIKLHVPIFSSLAWVQRKNAIELRIKNRIANIKARKDAKASSNIQGETLQNVQAL